MKEVLIVDDEKSIRELLEECLSVRHSCSTASNAEEAKILLTAVGFKVALTDIKMPGASGLDLLGYIKEHHPTVVVVMVSTDVEAAAEGVRRGAFDAVPKPFDLSEVRSVIARALNYWPMKYDSSYDPDM